MILAAGPWVGEFGYELFKWQSYLRALARDYSEVIVAGRPGHACLYADFADRYIEHAAPVGPCEGRFNAVDTDMNSEIDRAFKGVNYATHINPVNRFTNEPQIFVRYGHRESCEPAYDVVVHARAIQVDAKAMVPGHKSMKEQRNCTADKWEQILSMRRAHDLRICCIGSPTAALHLPGTDDKRGISLSDLADLVSRSRMIVGPSSGPMHFATLCDCPQVVWGTANLERRYETDWNPFGTPVAFVSTGEKWEPPVADVQAAMRRFMHA
jgi:hypothetical protein